MNKVLTILISCFLSLGSSKTSAQISRSIGPLERISDPGAAYSDDADRDTRFDYSKLSRRELRLQGEREYLEKEAQRLKHLKEWCDAESRDIEDMNARYNARWASSKREHDNFRCPAGMDIEECLRSSSVCDETEAMVNWWGEELQYFKRRLNEINRKENNRAVYCDSLSEQRAAYNRRKQEYDREIASVNGLIREVDYTNVNIAKEMEKDLKDDATQIPPRDILASPFQINPDKLKGEEPLTDPLSAVAPKNPEAKKGPFQDFSLTVPKPESGKPDTSEKKAPFELRKTGPFQGFSLIVPESDSAKPDTSARKTPYELWKEKQDGFLRRYRPPGTAGSSSANNLGKSDKAKSDDTDKIAPDVYSRTRDKLRKQQIQESSGKHAD